MHVDHLLFYEELTIKTIMDLIEGCKIAAIFTTGYMAGSGIYISLVEVQSRRSLPAKALWQQFTRSFNMAAKSMVNIYF